LTQALQLTLKATPPDSQATELQIEVEAIPQVRNRDRPRMLLRAPLIVQHILLRPGKKETKVITEAEELDAGGIWVSSISSPTAPS
jgi:hypothetical protein